MQYEFKPNDIFHNTLKTHPRYELGYGEEVTLVTEPIVQAYKYKSNNHVSLSGEDDYHAALYGDKITTTLPLTCKLEYYKPATIPRLRSVKNAMRSYLHLGERYEYGLLDENNTGMIDIPSMLSGSGIKVGTVEVEFEQGRFYESRGILKMGEKVAGVVLHREAIILITNPDLLTEEGYKSIVFQGTSLVPSMTMLAHAPKNELTHSNNPTYAQKDSLKPAQINQKQYIQSETAKIKNTVESPYDDTEASFDKQTWISKIAIYDKDKNLIAVAKLANPVRKNSEQEYTFKLKLDI